MSLAAEYAGIEAIPTRLAWASGRTPKFFSGYVTVREREQLCVLFPALQLALEALQQASAGAKPTPQGSVVTASTPDGCHRVMLQKSYSAYSLYEAETRVTPHATWLSVERIGNDQLVALLAQAYHKEHWFVQQNDLIWYPR